MTAHRSTTLTRPQNRLATDLGDPALDGALCVEVGPDPWDTDYPEGNGDAVAICRTCPVIDACRERSRGATWGIWAGRDMRPGAASVERAWRRADREAARRAAKRGSAEASRASQREKVLERGRQQRAAATIRAEEAASSGLTLYDLARREGITTRSLRMRLLRLDRRDLLDRLLGAERQRAIAAEMAPRKPRRQQATGTTIKEN